MEAFEGMVTLSNVIKSFLGLVTDPCRMGYVEGYQSTLSRFSLHQLAGRRRIRRHEPIFHGELDPV